MTVETGWRRDRRRASAAWAAVAAVTLGLGCRPAPTGPSTAAEPACAEVITPAVGREIFRQLVASQGGDRCVLVDVATRVSVVQARWTLDGAALPPLVITPAACAPTGAVASGAYALQIDPRLAARCPATVAAVRRGVSAGAPQAADTPGEALVDSRWTFLALAALALALLLALGARAARRPASPDDAPWRAAMAATFLLAVALRLWVPPSLANWYAEVLGPSGELPTRFGPGFALFQAALRAVLPWSDTTLFRADALVGALAVPLFVALLRERAVDRTAALAAGALFALAPFHVRVSASASEHALASTLALAALLAWVRGVGRGDRLLVALALVLVPLASLTRADVWLQLAVVPLWALLRDRDETPARSRAALAYGALYALVWAATGAFVYATVVGRSHHPLPERSGIVAAARQLLWQYVPLSFGATRWFSPVGTVFAALGALVMLVRRPALLACALVTLAVSFVPLGRNFLHDELLSARYFLLSIPVFLLPAGVGFRACLGLVERRLPRWAPAAAVAALGVAAFVSCRSAYRARYTFEDEYTFLRRHAAALPAGCVVWQLVLRDQAFERDLDCCLDAPRTPLTAAFPSLRFRSLLGDPATWPRAGAGGPRCEAYYEGAACALTPTAALRAERPRSFALLEQRCAAVRAAGGLRAVASGVASPRASNPAFTAAPRVGLYLWTRP